MEIILILIHLTVCIAVYLLIKCGRLKSSLIILPAVAFIPVCGLIILCIEECRARKVFLSERQLGVESLKVSDVRYKRIEVDDDTDKDITVPLEEAITVNSANVRRRLMMDILHRNPEEYIDLLQMTRTAEDTELTHYATTTMMEIQNHYEAQIHEISQEYRENHADIRVLKMYRKVLLKYIESGLISGRVLEIYRKQLDDVLSELCRQLPENMSYFENYIENRIILGENTNLEAMIHEMIEKWPKEESVYRIYVEYLWNNNRGDEIWDVLEQIKNTDVYLSGRGKDWLTFWEKKDL